MTFTNHTKLFCCLAIFTTGCLMLTGSFASAQPVPTARYTFDDGTAVDSSGNGLNGTLIGSAQIVTNFTRPFARADNKVLLLNGANGGTGLDQSYVNISDPSGLLNFAGTNATVATWVYVNLAKNQNALFSQGEWRRGASLTVKHDSTPPDLLWAGKNPQSFNSLGAVPLKEWTHVAATWRVVNTNTEVTFYINGVTNGSFLMTNTLQSPVNGSAIGREWRNSVASDLRWVFNGMIDDMQVFKAALTPEEMSQLYFAEAPPSIAILAPADGAASYPTIGGIQFNVVSAHPVPTPNIHLYLNSADVSGGMSFSGSSTNWLVSYSAPLQPNKVYSVRALATDDQNHSTTRVWSFDTIDPGTVPVGVQLDLADQGTARQTLEDPATRPAALALDGNVSTFSETPDVANSFWEVELARPFPLTRIELVPPAGDGLEGILQGLTVRISDLRDCTMFEATVDGSGLWATNFPTPVNGRIVRIGLENGATNGAGDHRVALSEVRIFGDPSPVFGPLYTSAVGQTTQSSTNGGYSASLAIDNLSSTFCETLDQTNSWWMLKLDLTRPIQQVELINRASSTNAIRMQGLTLRILDDASNSIASALVSNPGPGNSWIYNAPPNTTGRFIRIGLENGATNGQGNRIVSLAEVNVLTAANVLPGKECYMVHVTDAVPPDSNANDGIYATETSTPLNTHDPYWEANLGTPQALYAVRVVAATGLQSDMSHATLSLFNEAHDLVFMQHLAGSSETFDVALPGPVFAQYVRVGLEFAERSRSGSSWFIGMKEVQAFGRPTNEVGIPMLSTSSTQIAAGSSSTLSWQQEGLFQLDLHPNIGSVGSNTAPSGLGSIVVAPVISTEYSLVGSNYAGTFVRHTTINVDGVDLPPLITEVMADNSLSLKDGNKSFSDWIEVHNPNNTVLNLGGYYLSDSPYNRTQWQFPPGVILPPHGYLVVFANGATSNFDAAGSLHANFSLNKDGESILLTAPDGVTVLDGLTGFPAQMTDLAYGRTLDGHWSFIEPTPGAPNLAASYEGWLPPVAFSHPRGWQSSPFALVVSHPDPNAQVFWSTDGTEPTNLYTAPLAITNAVGVRASVVRAGWKSPRIQTRTYLFLDGIVDSPALSATYRDPAYAARLRQGFLDLPVFSINVPPPDSKWAFLGYNKERPERAGSVEIFMPDGSAIQQDCGINHYGGQYGTGTGLYAKKTWQLSFKKKFGASKLEFPLFAGFDRAFPARASFKELDLHAGNQDQGGYSSGRGFYMSHRFAEDTMLDMGSLNPHGRFVHLFMNGKYLGQFDAHERLTADFLDEYLGGASEDYLTIKGNDNSGTYGFSPGVADPDPPGRQPWLDLRANRFSFEAIKDTLDVDNYIDFMLLWEWGNSESEFRGAGARRVTPGDNRGFKFWFADADGLLRQQSGASGQTNKNNVTSSVFTNGPAYIFGALLAEGNPDFKTRLADRIYKHFFNGGALTPEAATARLNARMDEITNSMVAECARWGSASGYTPAAWQGDAQYARDNIFPNRPAILMKQFRTAGWYPAVEPPQFSQRGGVVTNRFSLTFAAGQGSVYYTLDGSDPRLNGGAVSATALLWNGLPLVLNGATKVRSRLLNGTVWSALNEATFYGAHPLALGSYLLTSWNASEPAGSYPPYVLFQQTATADPDLSAPMNSPWTLAYNLTSRSRVNGLGTNGFSFINTDNPQAVAGAGFVGAAVLSLNTLGVDDVRVKWTAGTVLPNTQIQGIRLQYRVGVTAPFTDVLDSQGNPVEYIRDATAGHSSVIGPVALPSAATNQPYVELRWKYYHVSGTNGARAQLRVDDIKVSMVPPRPQLGPLNLEESGAIHFAFDSVANELYQLEYKNDLSDSTWTPLGPVVLGTGAPVQVGEPTRQPSSLLSCFHNSCASFRLPFSLGAIKESRLPAQCVVQI